MMEALEEEVKIFHKEIEGKRNKNWKKSINPFKKASACAVMGACLKILSMANDVLNGTLEIRPTSDKWDLVKLEVFCTAKETVNQME